MDKIAIQGWIVWIQSVEEHIEDVEFKKRGDGKTQAIFTLKTPEIKLGKFITKWAKEINTSQKA